VHGDGSAATAMWACPASFCWPCRSTTASSSRRSRRPPRRSSAAVAEPRPGPGVRRRRFGRTSTSSLDLGSGQGAVCGDVQLDQVVGDRQRCGRDDPGDRHARPKRPDREQSRHRVLAASACVGSARPRAAAQRGTSCSERFPVGRWRPGPKAPSTQPSARRNLAAAGAATSAPKPARSNSTANATLPR